jgi:hypothetical protein
MVLALWQLSHAACTGLAVLGQQPPPFAATGGQHIPNPLLLSRFRRASVQKMLFRNVADIRCRISQRATLTYLLRSWLSWLSMRCRCCLRQEDPLQAEAVWLGVRLSPPASSACANGALATVHAGWGMSWQA